LRQRGPLLAPGIRWALVGLVAIGLGAAAGWGAKAYRSWQAEEARAAARREAERIELDQRAAGIALRGAISDLYRHDAADALEDLTEAKEADPGNGYTHLLTAIALVELGRTEEAVDSVSLAGRRDWTDYSHLLGLPTGPAMRRERELLERAEDELCEAFADLPRTEALAALDDLREAGLRLADLRPASPVHLQRGAHLRLHASRTALDIAGPHGTEETVARWAERVRLDGEWSQLVKEQVRGLVSSLADTQAFSSDAWAERLEREEGMVADLIAQAPE
jgi:tetratricopeptide (TPR) repeat protein